MVAPLVVAPTARHLMVAFPEAERGEDHHADGNGRRQPVPGRQQAAQVCDDVEDQADEAGASGLFAVTPLPPNRRDLLEGPLASPTMPTLRIPRHSAVLPVRARVAEADGNRTHQRQ